MLKKSIALLVLLLCLNSTGLHADTWRQVRIYFDQPQQVSQLAQAGLIFDHVHAERRSGGFACVAVVDAAEYAILQQSGLAYTVLIADLEAEYATRPQLDAAQRSTIEANSMVAGFDFGSMGGFYTLNEVIAELDSMRAQYPTLVSQRQSLGVSHEGRDVWMVRLSDNPDIDEEEPEVLYTALHHAREPQGMMTLIYYMYYLLENYGSDPEATYLLENRELYVVPVINPDGYAYNQQTNPNGGGNWRKNRRVNGGGSFGVDLNRNYGYEWGFDNEGSSPDPGSNTFRGPSAFSEPETQVMRDFCNTREFKAALNYHTYSNLLIYPFGYVANLQAPDSALFGSYAAEMTSINNYAYGTANQTVGYLVNGSSDDWMYGEQTSKPAILAMTPEVGSPADGFWPSQDRIFPLAEENLYSNLYLAWAVGGLVAAQGYTLNEIGDGNGYLDAGESAQLVFEVQNIGLGEAANVTFALSAGNPDITISGGGAAPLTLPSRQTAQSDTFLLDVAAAVAPGTPLELQLTISVDGIPIDEPVSGIVIGTPQIAFASDAEEGTAGWNTGQSWNTVSSTAHSGAGSFADSPVGNYGGGVNNSLTLQNPVDLSNSTTVFLEFWAKWDIEANYDYARVQASVNGSSWTSLAGLYTRTGSGLGVQTPGEPGYDGVRSAWVKESIDISQYAGGPLYLRFNLSSDSFVEGDGWFVDDISVLAYPESITAIEPGAVLPQELQLLGNYPNPFNPQTTIRFALPQRSDVKLSIYNLLGQEVAELVNGTLDAGIHAVRWNARNRNGERAASGFYFTVLENGGEKQVRKMLLAR